MRIYKEGLLVLLELTHCNLRYFSEVGVLVVHAWLCVIAAFEV